MKVSYLAQECHPKEGFAGHALQVAVKVLDSKGVFAKPQLHYEQPELI